jgi:hypothetical protein
VVFTACVIFSFLFSFKLFFFHSSVSCLFPLAPISVVKPGVVSGLLQAFAEMPFEAYTIAMQPYLSLS